MSGSVALLRRHGIFAGLSTGAAHLAALWERKLAPERTVLFLAPDTGHRYVDSVFSRHGDAADVEAFTPQEVSTLDSLALPWCRIAWNGSTAPEAAAHVPL